MVYFRLFAFVGVVMLGCLASFRRHAKPVIDCENLYSELWAHSEGLLGHEGFVYREQIMEGIQELTNSDRQ